MPRRNSATAPPASPRIRRNDWSALRPPELGHWQATRSVSLIVPAHNCQNLLDVTLAALRHQTYPAELFEVVVVDDGSRPPVDLPELRPANCRIVRATDHSTGWGRAHALHTGVTHSDGEILHWLDADMVAFPQHVEAQARWHHVSDEVVTLGYKRFVDAVHPDPWEVSRRCADGSIDQLYRLADTEPHDYVEQLIESTSQLRAADHLAFRAHVGATAALTRTLYRETGGLDTDLRLGEDTEFGYRLAQAGAVFVPEPRARSWHLGPSHMMTRGTELRRYNQPFLADLMPQPGHLRPAGNRCWRIPLVTVVIPATGGFELVRTCVDRVLAGDQTDLRVKLVADWSTLTDGRRQVLADPLLDLRLLAANYRSEPRVDLVPRAPRSAYPGPFLLDLPTHAGVGASTVRRLIRIADQWQVGLVRLLPSGARGPAEAVTLWRTSAVHRARRAAGPGEPLDRVVAEVAGERWVSGHDLSVLDLRRLPVEQLVPPGPRLVEQPDRRSRQATDAGVETVAVGGARSLARAARFVFRRYRALATDRLSRRLRRSGPG